MRGGFPSRAARGCPSSMQFSPLRLRRIFSSRFSSEHAFPAHPRLAHAGCADVGERIAVQQDKVGAAAGSNASPVRKAVLSGSVFCQGRKGVSCADRLGAEHVSGGRLAQDGTTRRFQRVGRADGRVLMQRKGDAARECRSCGRDALCPRAAQVFEVFLSPVEDVGGKEGGDDAQPCRFVQFVLSQDLSVNEHGADDAAFAFGEAGQGIQEHFCRAVPVAVGEQLRALSGGMAAGGENFLLPHEADAPSAAEIRLAQEGGFLLRGAVQEDLHAADPEAPRPRKARACLGIVGGGGVGDDVGEQRVFVQQHLVEGEHLPGEKPLLRERHAVGEVFPLRLQKGGEHVPVAGGRDALRGGEIFFFLQPPASGDAEQGTGGRVERPRVAGAHLHMQRPGMALECLLSGQNAGVPDADELALRQIVQARESLGGGEKVLRRAAVLSVRLQQGERTGEDVRMCVGKGGQYRGSAQGAHLVKGGTDGAEVLPVCTEGGLPRKGHTAVFKQRLHGTECCPRARNANVFLRGRRAKDKFFRNLL